MGDTLKGQGPNGFIEFGQIFLVVDYGKICHDGSTVGFLFEDGLMQGLAASNPLGQWEGLKTIEEFPGLKFTGIDGAGRPLELPGTSRGPTGSLSYNGKMYTVLFGRIATEDHRLVGQMSDDGNIAFHDPRFPDTLRKVEEDVTQLPTTFQGIKSNLTPWQFDYKRKLHKPDLPYWKNEINRYFQEMERLKTAQKDYTIETMEIFAQCGILQLVTKNQGNAGLGNVKHGASGVTGVRSGNVTLDKEEFEKEVGYYKRFGALMAVPARIKPLIEVRLNLVVAHEFGHQLEFCLSQKTQDRITEIYNKRLRTCDRLHPLPDDYEGAAELLRPNQVDERIFISGYARSSMHEYWAESVGAFAVKESRDILKQIDPDIHAILSEVILEPEKTLSVTYQEAMLNLQSSLRAGGEMPDNILNK